MNNLSSFLPELFGLEITDMRLLGMTLELELTNLNWWQCNLDEHDPVFHTDNRKLEFAHI